MSEDAQDIEETSKYSVTVREYSSPSGHDNASNSYRTNHRNNKIIRLEKPRTSFHHYEALPGTDNLWSMFDIRRGARNDHKEAIGVRFLIVGMVFL